MQADNTPVRREPASLIESGERQLRLIPLTEMPDDIFLEGERGDHNGDFEFTGERLFEKDFERYCHVVSMLAANVPIRRIGRLLHLSPNTIDAVRDRERGSIEAVKKRLSLVFKDITLLSAEALKDDLLNRPDLISAYHKAIIMGVASEKSLLYDGDPTVIFGAADQVPKPVHEDFNRLLEEATKSTGRGDGNPPQKVIEAEFTMVGPARPGEVAGAAPVVPGAEGESGANTDKQSAGLDEKSQQKDGKS